MSNSPLVLVADASAIINLNSTAHAEKILRALPERLAVVDIVRSELEEGCGKGRRDAEKLDELVAKSLVDIVSLGDVGDAIFERLVAGSALSTVDDGEAATIAYAVEKTQGVVIDDGKARRICKEMFPGVRQQCSVEIFQKQNIMTALGHETLAVALTSALRSARMQVHPEHFDWVIRTIGKEAAASCTSIPRRLLR